MTDQFDQATEFEDRYREQALQAARGHQNESPVIDCDNCHGATKKGWECAFYADCLQDWSRAEGAKRRNVNAG